MGKVEIYARSKRTWIEGQRGYSLNLGDKIRTGPKSEADLRVPDQIRLRLKENSEAEVKKPGLFEKTQAPRYQLHLRRGSLIGMTEKGFEGKRLEISTPVLVAAVLGTSFQVVADDETGDSSVRVLRGSVEVQSLRTRKTVTVRSLEKADVKAGESPTLEPARISREEWNQLKEAYEFVQKSAALEARQLDLSKEAGNLFQYVFDHGTFYTPKFGFTNREFVKDEATGEVHLEIEYDVFPTGSYVGIYFKTRNLDISKFKGLEFEVRGLPEEGYPESMKIEFKSGAGVVRAFVPRDFKEKWAKFQYPLRFNRATDLTEITFVFSNEKVGSAKKGMIHVRNLTLVPIPPEELAKRPAPKPKANAAKAAPAPAAAATATQPA